VQALFALYTLLAALLRTQPAQADSPPPGCTELIRNGSFESISADWVAQPSTRPPAYDNVVTFDGSLYAMRLGITDLANLASSSAVEQTVVLPTNATSIVLTFRYYTVYDGPTDAGDFQYFDIYNVANGQLVARPMQILRNDRTWLLAQYDLRSLAGQQLRLIFGVTNDGNNGRAAMYVDNVSLISCSATPTPLPPPPTNTPFPPTATLPPATFTPLPPLPTAPAGCTNLTLDGSFETDGAWILGEDPVPPRYVGEPRRSGGRAIQLGNPSNNPIPDVYSYSSVRQLVTLPANTTVAQLRWWHFYQSQEGPAINHPLNADCQEVILLTPDLKTLAILHRMRRNDAGWVEEAIDLTPFRGQSFYLYYNTVNNGNGQRTWMYLDDVSLTACFSGVSAVVATPVTPVAVFTPIPVVPTAGQAIPVITATSMALSALQQAAPQPTPQVGIQLQPLGTLTPEGIVASAEQPSGRAMPGAVVAVPLLVTPETANRIWWLPAIFTETTADSRSTAVLNRLGTVAVLLGILVIIGLLLMAIVRMIRGR
jgi:hypothetical protein